MDVHQFDKSLQKEENAMCSADDFYLRAPFSVSSIQRYNQNTKEHLMLQRKDIDLSLSFKDNRIMAVSEKFREHDYNDLLLEIYSKFPGTKGWIHKSDADRLAYFFPKRMFWIDKKALCIFCTDKLFPLIEREVIKRLLSREANSLKVGLNMEGRIYECILTQAFNNTNNAEWNTISISVPFAMLEDFKIRFQQFKL